MLAVRARERGEQARAAVLAAHPGLDPALLEVRELDVGSLASVRAFVHALGPVPVSRLVLNAGVMCVPYGLSPEQHEQHLATNFLGHALLTFLLLPQLDEGARVLSLVSETYRGARFDPTDPAYTRQAYVPFQAYADSKAVFLAWTLELDQRLRHAQSSVRALAVNPGSFQSNINQHLPPLMRWGHGLIAFALKSLEQASATTLYCALAPPQELAPAQGQVFFDAQPHPLVPGTQPADPAFRARIWALTQDLVGERWTPPRSTD